MYFFALALIKIYRVAFQYMRLVRSENIYFTRLESLHATARYQRALAFDDPGNLCFVMSMKMIIKMRQNIFLYYNRMFFRYRQCELYYFHFTNITKIAT